jgi:AI-2 transport protein TqsA
MPNSNIKIAPSILVNLAALVVIVAGLRMSSPILIPVLVAAFLTVLGGPTVLWLKEKGLPSGIAVLLVVTIMLSVLVFAGVFIGNSVNQFINVIPEYKITLQEKGADFIQWLNSRGLTISGENPIENIDFGFTMDIAATLLTSLGGLLTNTFLILFIVLLSLLEVSGMSSKLKAVFETNGPTLVQYRDFTARFKNYLVIKTAISMGTGVLAGTWCYLMNVDFPVIIGFLAFFLNYIPNFGSIIAAIPAVIIALVEQGLWHSLIVAAGFLAINIVIGSFLEPRFMGKGLGLSPLVVFVSMAGWTWILGPVGAFLSVPLTITIKIALETNESTRWLGVLMSREAPGDSPEGEGFELEVTPPCTDIENK